VEKEILRGGLTKIAHLEGVTSILDDWDTLDVA